MKVIFKLPFLKNDLNNETYVEMVIPDPSSITVGQFAKLFLNELKETYTCTIESTPYTLRHHLLPEDFKFINTNGRSFSPGREFLGRNNELLADHLPAEVPACTVYVMLQVLGKNNYSLHVNINKKIFPSKQSFFKLKDLANEKQPTRDAKQESSTQLEIKRLG